jgi:hypothetical protein
MNIDLHKTFGVDLCRETSVRKFLTDIPSYDLGEVTLNFCGCAVDYPATGLIANALIEQFDKRKRAPFITYVYDIELTEGYYLKWFVFEAPFVGFTGEFEAVALRQLLSEQMRRRKGKFTIRIVSFETGLEKERFTYE